MDASSNRNECVNYHMNDYRYPLGNEFSVESYRFERERATKNLTFRKNGLTRRRKANFVLSLGLIFLLFGD